MKKNLILLLSIGFFALSCEEKPGQGSTVPKNESAPADSATKSANSSQLGGPESCKGLSMDHFCARGMQFIALGDPVSALESPEPGIQITDTIFKEVTNAGTWEWKVRKWISPKGQVWFEADFKENKYLNRIRIESPEFKSLHQIGVGNTVGDLLNTYSGFRVSPYPEMGIIEITLEAAPTIFFHVSDKDGAIQKMLGEEADIHKIPASAKIERIVIWDIGGMEGI